MFFTSLITPAILLVLYVTFLGDIYRDSFTANLPEGLALSEKLLDGLVGGQLISSILAVSCVTVAFCSNFLMVNDKALGTANDFRVSPVKPSLLALGYYIATLACTLIICFAAAALCLFEHRRLFLDGRLARAAQGIPRLLLKIALLLSGCRIDGDIAITDR